MRWFRIAMPLAAALCVPTTASAETKLVEYPKQFIAIAPAPPSSKQIRYNEAVLVLPLVWEQAAVFTETAVVEAGGRHRLLSKTVPLPMMRLAYNSSEFAKALSFCTPQAAQLAAMARGAALFGHFGQRVTRSTKEAQFCVIDKDGNGTIDHSVMVGGGRKQERIPRPIGPYPYRMQAAAPLGDDSDVRIIYRNKGEFELAISQYGQEQRFDMLTVSNGGQPIVMKQMLEGKTLEDGSYGFEAFGLSFRAVSQDTAGSAVKVEWPAIEAPIVFAIPNAVTAIGGWYP